MKQIIKRQFSTHSKIAIIGGGSAGINVSAQLVNSGVVAASDIKIFEPRREHYYQPAFTMVAGGVIGTPERAFQKESKYICRPMSKMLKKGVIQETQKVTSFEPDSNKIITKDGAEHTYDAMIVAAGVSLRFDKIEGAVEALDDHNHPAVSMYELSYAYQASKHREAFKGGKAIFTLPTMPIKCGGAPQKFLYLSEETFRKNGIRDKCDVHFYTTVGNMFPNCLKYADQLGKIVKSKNIDVHFQHLLTKVDKHSSTATFKNLKTEEEEQVKYDFLHIVPPQTTGKHIFNSPLAAANGFVDVNPKTLQHNKWDNIFAVGDCANLPTAKTAAGVFSQSPVLVHNLIAHMEGQKLNAAYTGYNSCPLFVGDKKLMMIEFKYDNLPNETFYSGQTTPNWMFYMMKKEVFPWVYFNVMPTGRWFGRDMFSKPTYF